MIYSVSHPVNPIFMVELSWSVYNILHIRFKVINVKTYINNEEVQPAPSVGEVGLETIRNPFQKHLNDKNIGEDLICIFQNDFNHSSLLNVNILKCLNTEEKKHEFRSVWKKTVFSMATLFSSAHQSTTAEKNHEDDEGLKIVVLHNGETGLTKVPPGLSFVLGDVQIQAWTASNASFSKMKILKRLNSTFQ